MRTEVIGKHLEITPAIREFAEQKTARLTRYFDGVQMISVRCEEDTHSNKKDDRFHVEITVDVVHHEDFVANAKGTDLYHCIEAAVEKASRQITDFKERLRTHKGGMSADGSKPH